MDGGNGRIGTSQTLQLTVRVDEPDRVDNVAGVVAATSSIPSEQQYGARCTATPQQADLSLVKTVEQRDSERGRHDHLHDHAHQQRPDAATSVQVTDLLPAGLTFVSATPSPGTYDPRNRPLERGTVTPVDAADIAIDGHVDSPAAAVNTARSPTPTSSTPTRPTTPERHRDAAAGRPGGHQDGQQPDAQRRARRSPTRHADQQRPRRGHGGAGDRPAAGGADVRVGDAGPGTYDPATGVWTVGTVGAGSPGKLPIQATVVSPIRGPTTAAISHAAQFDPDPSNNRRRLPTRPCKPT